MRYFDRGSDDVVTKPFRYPELRGRIGALLRRSRPRDARAGHAGRRAADRPRRPGRARRRDADRLSGEGVRTARPPGRRPDARFTKHELLRDVWGFRAPGRTRTVDSHACKLRHKLADTADRRFIENIWGVGYRLIAPSQQRKDEARHETRPAAAQDAASRGRTAPTADTARTKDPVAAGTAEPVRQPRRPRADGGLRCAAREGGRPLVHRLPADQGHHAGAPHAPLARRLRSPRLRRALMLDAPPRVRHRAARAAAVPGARLADGGRARRPAPRADRSVLAVDAAASAVMRGDRADPAPERARRGPPAAPAAPGGSGRPNGNWCS